MGILYIHIPEIIFSPHYMQLSFRIIMPLIRTVAFFKRSFNVTSIVRYSSICKQKSFNPTEARISVDKINYVHNFEFKRTISVLNNRLHSADKSANSEFQFDKECDETLESLCEHFEEILEGMINTLEQKFVSFGVSNSGAFVLKS